MIFDARIEKMTKNKSKKNSQNLIKKMEKRQKRWTRTRSESKRLRMHANVAERTPVCERIYPFALIKFQSKRLVKKNF